MSVTWYERIEDALATGVPEEKLLHEGTVWGVDDADVTVPAEPVAPPPAEVAPPPPSEPITVTGPTTVNPFTLPYSGGLGTNG